MCLIIASPTGTLPDAALVERAARVNPHGFGIASADGRKLTVSKTMDTAGAGHYAALQALGGKPYVAHWRMATSGRRDVATAHPFVIGSHVALAHNGIIPRLGGASASDTLQLVDLIKSRLSGVVSLDTVFAQLVQWTSLLGDNGKYALLDASGAFAFLNEDEGTWKDGIWYSNEHSFENVRSSVLYGNSFGGDWPHESRGNRKAKKSKGLRAKTVSPLPTTVTEQSEYEAGLRAGTDARASGCQNWPSALASEAFCEGYSDGFLADYETDYADTYDYGDR